MSIITKLTALLTADSAQFEAGIKKAKNSFSGFQGALVKGAGIAAGAIATVGVAFVALGIKQAAVIDANSKLAASLGLTYREFENLNLVASESGVEQAAFTTALTKTQQAIFDAANGSKSMVEAFGTLGLSVKDLIGLSPSGQFIRIGEALNGISDPTVRTALAMDIFGKSGRGVINMLEDLRAKVAEADAFNQKFGLSLSDIDAAKVEEAGDAFGRVGMIAQGAGNTIAVTFSPFVTEASNALVESSFSAEQFRDAIRTGMKIAGYAIDAVVVAIKSLQVVMEAATYGILESAAKIEDALGSIAGDKVRNMANASREKLRGLTDELKNYESVVTKIDNIQTAANQRAATSTGKKGNSTGADLDSVLSNSSAKTKELTEKTKDLKDVWEEFGKSSGNAIDNLINDLGRGGNAMQSFRNFAVSMLQDILKGLNGGNSIGSSIGSLLGNAFKGMAGSSYIGSTYGVGGDLGSTLGSLYSSSVKGSFATGISNVPYDMTARLHKGEAVIPASQVDNMGTSGGTVINIDARGAQQGVEEKIRQVMSEVQQLRADTPKIALNIVSDQNRRNPNFVR